MASGSLHVARFEGASSLGGRIAGVPWLAAGRFADRVDNPLTNTSGGYEYYPSYFPSGLLARWLNFQWWEVLRIASFGP
ncbi:hypothetical protein AWC20_10065 [Mycobacterium parmense]|nr:hypothetical protein AWC20_10065 [Mycobacterium parmense]